MKRPAVVAMLSAGERVVLRLPYVGALPATVEDVPSEQVVVSLTVPDARVARLAGRDAAVERATRLGIDRWSGPLRVLGTGDLVAVAHHGPERVQRRAWARVDAVVAVTVTPLDDELEAGATTTVDLSGGGLRIRDPWALPVGSDVRLVLELPEGPVVAVARVIRDAGNDCRGVRIDEIAADGLQTLVRFVREREQAALRTARPA